MLVLTRRIGESFFIGDNVEVVVEGITGDKVKISISAPKEITILRKELLEAQRVNKEALVSNIDTLASFKKKIRFMK